MTWNWKFVVALILALLVMIFSVQNHEIIELHFLVWVFSASMALMLSITLCLGICIGFFVYMGHQHRKRGKNDLL